MELIGQAKDSSLPSSNLANRLRALSGQRPHKARTHILNLKFGLRLSTLSDLTRLAHDQDGTRHAAIQHRGLVESMASRGESAKYPAFLQDCHGRSIHWHTCPIQAIAGFTPESKTGPCMRC